MTTVSARFRERVEIWRNTSTANDPDPTTFTKDDGPTEPAEIVDTKGGEVIRGRTIEAYVSNLITLQYHTRTGSIRAKDKLICKTAPYEDVTFNITGAAIKRVQGRPRFIELDCVRDG